MCIPTLIIIGVLQGNTISIKHAAEMFSRCTNKCKNQKNKECTYEGLAGMEGTQGAATPKISPIHTVYTPSLRLNSSLGC